MKIFVKPNPFWKMILWIILGIIIWTATSVIVFKITPEEPIGSIIFLSFFIGALTSIVAFIIGGLLYCIGGVIYDAYKESYPKKPKKQKPINSSYNQLDYDIQNYKNNLKNKS